MPVLPRAYIIIIDNTDTSIDGDFYPNRLEAQKTAASRLIQYLSKQSNHAQFGIGVIGKNGPGVVTSLTSDSIILTNSILSIQTGGKAQLIHTIRCSFLAFKNTDTSFMEKSIIAFIGTHNDVNRDNAGVIARIANESNVSINIVSMGSDVDNNDILEELVGMIKCPSYIVKAESSSSTLLSDVVLASQIGPGDGSQLEDPDIDPDLALTIQMSLEDNQDDLIDDEELRRVIQESLQDSIDPHEMMKPPHEENKKK
ncbi:26S proteasome non-ATPase regulatory subunit 4 [Histomonas meleagridis]|uniref:26S proteasome non-ATPase regulatory subunit 4 n=1 Tax=Histomonas meleagridis TaxID=135588 RepID=UPI0035593ECC|nr:26S proteasome non-ATPase regulatory subunit 4 [Histomonas meleagridis]KAH0805419.1 26S proteasome non-ATPase regulatory subunit 4 [Histomonas meleagridis]